MRPKPIRFLGEAGAWLAMFYAIPVMFYFVMLVEPPLVADTHAGHTVPLDFDGLFVPYEGVRYVSTAQWWLYYSALLIGPSGFILWLLSLAFRSFEQRS